MSPSVSAPHDKLAKNVLTGHIIPSYTELAFNAEAMANALEDFCKNPVPEKKHHIDARFKTLVLSWARIEHIRFGPVATDNMYEKMNFWPDRKGIGRKQVKRAVRSGTEDVLDPRLLKKKSVALQGLGALEQLLYGTPVSTLLDGSEEGMFRCQFARSIAVNISDMVRSKILAPWQSGGEFSAQLLKPGPDNPNYLTNNEVVTEIAKTFLNGVFFVRDRRLAAPLGMRRGKRRMAQPVFERSGLSMSVVHANISGLRGFYISSGLKDWLDALEPGIGTSLLHELKLASDHASSIPVSLGDAVGDPNEKSKLVAMGFPLKNARALAMETLTKHTDLPLGLNALDGD